MSTAVDVAPPEPPAAPPPPDEDSGRKAFHELVHKWIPLGIVIVSGLAAVMGWRASLSDETSAHSEELSRQDIVHQQPLLVQDNHAIDADIQTFGQFAQYSSLAHSLRQGAAQLTGPVADQVLSEAQADLGVARYLGKQIANQDYAFDPSNPTGNPFLRSEGPTCRADRIALPWRCRSPRTPTPRCTGWRRSSCTPRPKPSTPAASTSPA